MLFYLFHPCSLVVCSQSVPDLFPVSILPSGQCRRGGSAAHCFISQTRFCTTNGRPASREEAACYFFSFFSFFSLFFLCLSGWTIPAKPINENTSREHCQN